VTVWIDAAIVAQHEVCIRATDVEGCVRTDRFRVQPALAGMRSGQPASRDAGRDRGRAGQTSMTWLGLSVGLAGTPIQPVDPAQLALRRACVHRERGGDRRQPVSTPG
jgi:hypothetical protein